ncbi:MAG: Asp-tRNA(Asn)/Glu-tRNA(Gln) amidotransferase subunit GatA [Halobacteriota archaeon]
MSHREHIEETLETIECSDLNAFITVDYEGARRQAAKVDTGELDGRLAGIPVGIKDAISTKGLRTTCASKMLEHYVPPYDAFVIRRLREEGAVLIGKTNMDEFSMGASTETSFFGPCKNPWDLNCVPGGSSGGSAASVAAHEADLALGSDTGGSIRCPASFCGMVGLKPTYGRVSRSGLVSYGNSMEQIGPIARTVKACAVLFEIIAGHDPSDSTSLDIPVPRCASRLANDITGLKIGVPLDFFGEGVDPAVENATRDAIDVLEDLGARVAETSMPSLKYALSAYYIQAMSEASSNLARYCGIIYGHRVERDHDWHRTFSENRASGFGREVKRRVLLGTYALSAGYYDKYYLKALKARTLISADFQKAFQQYDALITPTMPYVAFEIGEKIEDPLSLYKVDINTVPVNLANLPALSVPCGRKGRLPIGMQIIGDRLKEALLFNIAWQFERNTEFNRYAK